MAILFYTLVLIGAVISPAIFLVCLLQGDFVAAFFAGLTAFVFYDGGV